MRTQVGIVGAGPAGLVLAHLLHLRGIDSVVLESRSREYVESRIRAGVLEQGTVDLLTEIGVGDRLRREGLVHEGIELQFDGERHRIHFTELTGGRSITVYGQQEVVKDLIAARLETGRPLLFEAEAVEVDADRAVVRYRHDGAERHARVRRRRGLRRVPRRLPRLDPGRRPARDVARVPVRLARHPRRGRRRRTRS